MSANSPIVSVIMPAYNVEDYIEEAIQSILEQTFTGFELIISDDASQDKTLDCITRFKDGRIKLIRQPVNTGYVCNMNTLLRAAQGKYIVIQDADDYSTKDRLGKLVAFLEAHQNVDLVGSSYVKYKGVGKEEIIQMPSDSENIHALFDAMQYPLPVLNGSVMFRRKIVDAGLLYRDLKYVNRAQDDDWLFRVSEQYTMANLNEALYCYRSNELSMTQHPSSYNRYTLWASDFVQFLKKNRTEKGVDLLSNEFCEDVEVFFKSRQEKVLKDNPAFFEIYNAGKYLGINDRKNAVKWYIKGLIKSPQNIFIWKKIIWTLVQR